MENYQILVEDAIKMSIELEEKIKLLKGTVTLLKEEIEALDKQYDELLSDNNALQNELNDYKQ